MKRLLLLLFLPSRWAPATTATRRASRPGPSPPKRGWRASGWASDTFRPTSSNGMPVPTGRSAPSGSELHLRTGLRDPDARAYRTDRQPACRRSVGALHDGAANRAHAGLHGGGSGVAQPEYDILIASEQAASDRRPIGSRTNATTPPNGSSSRGRSSASTSARATKRTSGSAPSPFTTRRRATTGCNTGR